MGNECKDSNFKTLIKQEFDARSDYDKDNERHPNLAAQLVSKARLQQGWKVLDLACGTGLVTYLAAAEVGTRGSVIGMDLSPGLLAQAEAKKAGVGLENVSFLEGDVESADFPAGSFDAILCSSAIFYFDMKLIGKRLLAWLKPGGLLAYNTLEAPFTPLLTLLHQLLQAQGCKDSQPPFTQLGTAEANCTLLQAAGYTHMQVDTSPGLLLEKTMPLEAYIDKGWQLVVTGFKPFFPSLETMSELDTAKLHNKFKAEAKLIGQSMMNDSNMVQDKHVNLWVIARATS